MLKSAAAAISAAQTDAAASVAARERHGDGGAEILADAAGLSRQQAKGQVKAAATLRKIPTLREAVESGRVPQANARQLATAADKAGAGAVASDPALLEAAETMRPEHFAAEARRWSVDRQGDDGAGEHARQRARRRLRVWDGDDGMMHLHADLDKVAGTRIANRLRRQARGLLDADKKTPSAGRRSFDQCMADALETLTSHGQAGGTRARPSVAGGRPSGIRARRRNRRPNRHRTLSGPRRPSRTQTRRRCRPNRRRTLSDPQRPNRTRTQWQHPRRQDRHRTLSGPTAPQQHPDPTTAPPTQPDPNPTAAPPATGPARDAQRPTTDPTGPGPNGSTPGGGTGARPAADICVMVHADDETAKLVAELPDRTRLPQSVLDALSCDAAIAAVICDRQGSPIWRKLRVARCHRDAEADPVRQVRRLLPLRRQPRPLPDPPHQTGMARRQDRDQQPRAAVLRVPQPNPRAPLVDPQTHPRPPQHASARRSPPRPRPPARPPHPVPDRPTDQPQPTRPFTSPPTAQTQRPPTRSGQRRQPGQQQQPAAPKQRPGSQRQPTPRQQSAP